MNQKKAEIVKCWLEKNLAKLCEEINAEFAKYDLPGDGPFLTPGNDWMVNVDIDQRQDGHPLVSIRTDSMAYDVLYDSEGGDYGFGVRWNSLFRERFEKRFPGMYIECRGQGILDIGD